MRNWSLKQMLAKVNKKNLHAEVDFGGSLVPDYAQDEYGATPNHVAALEKATAARYRKLKRS